MLVIVPEKGVFLEIRESRAGLDKGFIKIYFTRIIN